MQPNKPIDPSLQALPSNRWLGWILRAFILVAIFLTIGQFTAWVSRDALDHEAGFGRGVLHGAAMPLALPKLALGNDVAIYAAKNTGRAYNLGYTVGVNACGAMFFGVVFYRLSRWRRRVLAST